MGRLFWKFFFASWFALVLAAVGAAAAVSLQFRSRTLDGRPAPHRAVLDLAASTLAVAGPEALRTWLREADQPGLPRMYAVNAANEDLLGRDLSPAEVARARTAAAGGAADVSARAVTAAGGADYVVFMPAQRPGSRAGRDKGRRPAMFVVWPWMHVIAGTLASVLVSALLAWYMARPIRNLRAAFNSAAAGHLETRVAPLMGRRRDEIADLGRDFDRMAEQLQRLMAGQRRLLHDVSHELRSPLARLHVAAGLLRQSPDELEESLGRIEREVARLDDLVGEVLTLARFESGAVGSSSGSVNLSDLVADVVEDARFEAELSHKSVVVAGLDDVVVEGHAELLQRAFENVLRNAVKYTAPDTAVRVELRTDTARGRAALSVSDRGPGVSEAEIASLFEPFYRAGSAWDGKGFGLGLAIARRAIDVHAGTIRAENSAGGGLRVTIEIPLPRNAGAPR
jgi:two-component system OmpR family sensor kinase